jgi:hypothetical protein
MIRSGTANCPAFFTDAGNCFTCFGAVGGDIFTGVVGGGFGADDDDDELCEDSDNDF